MAGGASVFFIHIQARNVPSVKPREWFTEILRVHLFLALVCARMQPVLHIMHA